MSSRLAPGVVALALALALAACGGGPRHIEEITPVVSLRLTNTWVLDADESDDPEEALAPRTAPGGERPEAGGGRPPMGGRGGGMTGGRGGMPGGGMAGGRPGQGGPGGRMDPEAARTLRRLATMAPRTLDVTLTDSLVTLAEPGQDPWLLPFGEEVERELDGGVKVKARAEWENGRVSVTRSVDGGGWVRETYMPSTDGSRLVVAVEVSMGGPGSLEFQRVYRPRETASAPGA